MLLLTATVLGAIEVGAWSAGACSPARLATLNETGATVRVSASQQNAKLVGTVEVAGGRRKTFEAADCDALLDALALGVKLASVAAAEPAPPAPPIAPVPLVRSEPVRQTPRSPALRATKVETPRAVAAREETPPVPPRAEPSPVAAPTSRAAPVPRSEPSPAPNVVAAPVLHAELSPAPSVVSAPLSRAEPSPAPNVVAAPLSRAEALPAPNAVAAPVQRAEPSSAPAESGPPPSAAEVHAPPLERSTPRTVRFEVGARGAIVLAPAPGPAFGGEVSFAVLPGAGSAIELSILYARTTDLALGPARGRFSISAGRLTGCSPSLSLFQLHLSACGSFAAGAVWAQGVPAGNITQGYEVWLPWVDLGLAGKLSVALPLGLSVELRAGPTFPVTRHTFVFERPEVAVHQVGAVGFEGKLGMGLAW